MFDFLNHRTGRLDPSYAAIARKAGVCVRAVSDALKRRLRELGHSTASAAASKTGKTASSGCARRPTPTCCCRRATGAAEAAGRAASAGAGHLGRSTACADPRRPGRPGARSCGEGGGVAHRPWWRSGGRSGAPRGDPLEPAQIVVLPECRDCGETCLGSKHTGNRRPRGPCLQGATRRPRQGGKNASRTREQGRCQRANRVGGPTMPLNSQYGNPSGAHLDQRLLQATAAERPLHKPEEPR